VCVSSSFATCFDPSNIDFATLTRHTVFTLDFKGQFVFYRCEHVDGFLRRNVNDFDVVFGEEPAEI
jgi:hypothetical protein